MAEIDETGGDLGDLDEALAALPDASELEDEDLNGVSAVEPEAKPQRKAPKPRRGGRRVAREVPSPQAADAIHAEREVEREVRAATLREEAVAAGPSNLPPKSVFEGSRDALTVWPLVLEMIREKGFGPESIAIRIERQPSGIVELKERKTRTQELVPLVGSEVSGIDGVMSPAEALYDAILNGYHFAYQGPATYLLTFQWRFGGSGNIAGVPAKVELPLDHPQVIKAQLEAKASRERDAQIRSGAIPPAQRSPFGFPFLSFSGGQGQSSASLQQVAASPSSATISKETADELKSLSSDAAYLRGKMEAEAAARAAPPAAAAPPSRDPRLPPPGLSEDEWEEIQSRREAKRMGTAVAQALLAVGITPEVTSSLVKLAQGQGQPAMQATQAQQAPITAMGALKDAAALIKEVTDFQKKIGDVVPGFSSGGAEEKEKEEDDPSRMKPITGITFPGTDAPMAYGEKLEDETWTEYIIRLGVHNPAAAERFLGWAARTFDPVTIQKIGSAVADRMASKKAAPATPAASAGEAPKKLGWQPT